MVALASAPVQFIPQRSHKLMLISSQDPLNSEDDVSEGDNNDLFETDNVVVCQFDKVNECQLQSLIERSLSTPPNTGC